MTVPLGIGANMVRITLTAAAAYYIGLWTLGGFFHKFSGTVNFLLTLWLLLLLDAGLVRVMRWRRAVMRRACFFLLAVGLIGATAVVSNVAREAGQASSSIALGHIPAVLSGWSSADRVPAGVMPPDPSAETELVRALPERNADGMGIGRVLRPPGQGAASGRPEAAISRLGMEQSERGVDADRAGRASRQHDPGYARRGGDRRPVAGDPLLVPDRPAAAWGVTTGIARCYSSTGWFTAGATEP